MLIGLGEDMTSIDIEFIRSNSKGQGQKGHFCKK